MTTQPIETQEKPSTEAEAEAEQFVLTIPKAGRKFYNVGRSASYEAARRGEIPTIRIGRKHLVPVAAVMRRLAEAE